MALITLFTATAAAADIRGRVTVVDGDTFRVGAERVRLHGIDAPEQRQTCQTQAGADWACGAWVTDEVKRRYDGQKVRCAEITRDRYGRAVAKCFYGQDDIGQRLVEDGLAFAFRKYAMDYDLHEKRAVVAGAGLHAHRVQSPAAYRAARSAAPPPSDDRCVIKGNISGSGRIFHVPGQEHYARTRIAEHKGERWFCSDAEARAAGWRKARR